MKQWPFAHTIEITYRLENGELEVRTDHHELERRAHAGGDRVPSVFSVDRFIPQRMDHRGRRADALAARTQQGADGRDGTNRRPLSRIDDRPRSRDYNLDDVFSDLVRDQQGRATMSVAGKSQRLDVVLGPNFRSVVIWAPHPDNRGRGSQSLGAPAGPPGAATLRAERLRIAISSASSRWPAFPTPSTSPTRGDTASSRALRPAVSGARVSG